ncbi:MAG: hypothetical protein M3126_02815 [Candidatus Eremiobacteraeota bacterium]|nr:hypothetical protein [Candidatus Eremiobacteraeota bacterium]
MNSELLHILHSIENDEPPHAGFSIAADLRSLHLPSAGIIAVPIRVERGTARNADETIAFSFSAKDGKSFFPSFSGSLRSDPEGPSKSRIRLIGAYAAPMGIAGVVLDKTLLSSVAKHTLTAFLETLVKTAEASIQRHEKASIREERFNH